MQLRYFGASLPNTTFPQQKALNHMKSILLSTILVFYGLLSIAQTPYQFVEVRSMPTTNIKDQGNTGSCWSFSALSFLESELLRMGKGEHDLSEMFVVRHIYRDKCSNYVRRLGKANLSQGGLAHDALSVVERYGLVPESVYPGRKDTSRPFNHTDLETNLQHLCNRYVQLAQDGYLSQRWTQEIDSVLDAAFGVLPKEFTYKNGRYNPLSFRNYLGLSPNQYVHLTSFTHHPFYSHVILEIPDNFAGGKYYNVPLDALMNAIQYALQQGFTVEWDTDVSNEGFSREKGLAIVPRKIWAEKKPDEQRHTFVFSEEEMDVSQAYRQELFDRLITQDDHLMHIVGLLDEERNGLFYAVKNSWGEGNERKGYVYASDAYVRLNTISVTIHRDALPDDLRKRYNASSLAGSTVPATTPPAQINNVAPPSKYKQLEGEIMQIPLPKKGGSDTKEY